MDSLNYWREMGFEELWVSRQQLTPIADPISLDHQIMPIQEIPSDVKQQDHIAESGLLKEKIAVQQLDWGGLSERIHACRACELGCQRTQAVIEAGVRQAEWMIIGEAPGAEEDRLGQPFVGQAGKLLDAMLNTLSLSRQKSVYIANVLKCRPPNNRKPQPQEVAACVDFLKRQMDLVQPKILLAVGATAAQALLNTDMPIGRLRGQVHQYEGRPLIVTYHPAYLLRAPSEKSKVWMDLCLARRVFREL